MGTRPRTVLLVMIKHLGSGNWFYFTASLEHWAYSVLQSNTEDFIYASFRIFFMSFFSRDKNYWGKMHFDFWSYNNNNYNVLYCMVYINKEKITWRGDFDATHTHFNCRRHRRVQTEGMVFTLWERIFCNVFHHGQKQWRDDSRERTVKQNRQLICGKWLVLHRSNYSKSTRFFPYNGGSKIYVLIKYSFVA